MQHIALLGLGWQSTAHCRNVNNHWRETTETAHRRHPETTQHPIQIIFFFKNCLTMKELFFCLEENPFFFKLEEQEDIEQQMVKASLSESPEN